MSKVRVGIIGVGNCASALVQGASYYRTAPADEFVPGLMHAQLGPYHISDIEFSAAIDIDRAKVGKDLSEALVAPPNNTPQFAAVDHLGVPVVRGMTHDGIGTYMADTVYKAEGATDNIGSEEATKWYVEQILNAGCAMVNCMPVFIAREDYWQGRFRDAGVPIIGDDVKSQVGATITHRVLTRLFRDRGVKLMRTYQLNVGGNSDFKNMLERSRLESKKISKTDAVTSQLEYDIGAENVHIGPSDYVPWLADRKWAYIRMEGVAFGGQPLTAELKLEVVDSPNSAGVVIDAVRCCKIAMDRGLGGAVEGPSAYLMKSPPIQYSDEEARTMTEEFIRTASIAAGARTDA